MYFYSVWFSLLSRIYHNGSSFFVFFATSEKEKPPIHMHIQQNVVYLCTLLTTIAQV